MAFRLMQARFAVHMCQKGRQCPNQKSKIKHVHIQNFYIQLEKGGVMFVCCLELFRAVQISAVFDRNMTF